MEEIFYGDWKVIVSQKDAAFYERFRIVGSDASDGIYSGTPGLEVPHVSGNGWKIILEWNDGAGSGWQPSAVRKLAGYTVGQGLVVMLGADDNFSWAQDFDFNDMVLTLNCLDPVLNPLYPLGNSYNFTVPKKKEQPRHDQPGYHEHDPNHPDPNKRNQHKPAKKRNRST